MLDMKSAQIASVTFIHPFLPNGRETLNSNTPGWQAKLLPMGVQVQYTAQGIVTDWFVPFNNIQYLKLA